MVKSEKIRTLKDIELEKQRLRLEILKTEAYIQDGYRNILHAFTFKNLASSMINDISATTSVIGKAFSIGKAILAKRKKKHRDRDDQQITKEA
jgi:hypothetical protein